MKKITYIIFFSILFTVVSYGQNYTAIPDSNFEAALEALGYDDISGDNQVPTLLIENVTTLDINTQDISDLTGIEDFTALESLNYNYNSVTTIDLSQNTALKELSARNNGITNINLSNNTNLELLFLRGNSLVTLDVSSLLSLKTLNLKANAITNIDVSSNTLLETIKIDSNAIVSLDVSDHSNLTTLEVQNNNLDFLNLRNGNNTSLNTFNALNNTNLNCISVDDINYASNNFTDIDAQVIFTEDYCNYTAIPDPNFEAILEALGYDDISTDGQVPTILISGVTSLTIIGQNIVDLTGIEDFANLKNLQINYANNIATMDLSNNLLLETIDVRYNSLQSINISGLNDLQTFLANDNQLTNLDLSTNTNLVALRVATNQLSTLDVTNNLNLEIITCGDNYMETVDLSNNSALRRLDIAGSANLSSIDLSQNVNMEYVDVSYSNLSYLNIRNGNNVNLSNSDFYTSNNSNLECILVDDAAYSTTNWTNINGNTTFSDTYCRYTTIPDSNFEAVLNALGYDDVSGDSQVPTALIEVVSGLNVSGNNISDLTGIEGFTALENLFCRDNNLTSLDVSNNTALTHLNFSDNIITTIDVSNNTNLIYLDGYENMLTEIDISNNTELEGVTLYNNNISSLDISQNTALVSLDMISNSMLTTIDFSNNLLLESLYLSGTSVSAIDLEDQSSFTDLECIGCALTSLNLKNGNNTNLIYIDVTNNPNLICALVDDAAYATTNFTNIDAQTTFSETYCNYTAIPDSNFEAALEALGYDDISNDGQVPTALIDVVTSLNVSGQNITDLTGIEDFTAIESINVNNNQLVEINVVTNTNLKHLLVSNNDLTVLDVSTNTLLQTLNISYTAITALNTSNLNSLRFLYAEYSAIESLDLNSNGVLDELIINNTPITYLDIRNDYNTIMSQFVSTNCSNLNCVLVDDISYSENNWLNVDAHLTFSNTYCNYTAIPDSNFEAALEALGYDDISNDGRVPTAIISAVTSLTVTNKSIDDLTGIEDFTSLTNLKANNNNLGELNLIYNTALDTLNVSQNALTILDVTHNTNLINLNFNVNNLTQIDLSQNTNLEILNGYANNLTSLDLTNNTMLTKVFVYTNELSSIDISNSLVLEILYINNNEIASIDVSQNSNLKILKCDNNLLTTLDLSNNINLITLIAHLNSLIEVDISNSTLLERLYLEDNNITDLDVSNNLALTILQCIDNNISNTIDLSNHTALENVILNNNNITNLNIKNSNNTNLALFETFGNPNLDCILVDDPAYSSVSWTYIDAHTSFSDTYCRYTAIPDSNFEAALEALGYDDISGDNQVPTALIEFLTALNVSSNNISDLTGIEDFTALEILDASVNSLASINLTQNSNLRTLNVSTNTISSIDLSQNIELRDIVINSTGISALDLSSNINLNKLYASFNNLTTLELSNNTALTHLFLNDNFLNEIDLSLNTNLQFVNMSNNQLSSLNTTNNPLLAYLDLQNNLLTYLNTKSGGSTTSYLFLNTIGNDNLNCIIVDDLTHANNSYNVDAHTSFTEGYCNYTAIPDANFEAALDALGYDDISADGQVPTALIEVVTNLSVSGQNISDLTGIEDFTALEDLRVHSNLLTAIDISANTNLKVLFLHNNNLTALNVSTNILLENLRLENNSIISLDISTNTVLDYLNAEANGLTALDISNNTLMRVLDISYTAITALDTSNLNDLEFLYAQYSDIESLDLRDNGVLDDLFINNTPIASLDIRNGYNTSMAQFNATNCPNLSCVSVDDAPYSENYWNAVDASVSFTESYCNYTAVPDSNFEAELEALGYDDISGDNQVPTALIENVTILNVINKGIADLTGIEDFTALETLNANENSITSIDLSTILNLQTLALNFNNLAAIDISANTQLKSFGIAYNNVNSISLSNNTLLTYLYLSENPISELDVSTNINLKTVNVFGTNIETLDLHYNTQLEVLSIYNNSALSYVNLDNNNNSSIEEDRYDSSNTPLLSCIKVSDFSYAHNNWTNKDSATSFSDTYCRYTAIPDSNFEAALEALGYDDISGDSQVPTALIEVVSGLNVSSNNISDLTGVEDFTALENLFCRDNNLTSLDVSNNTALTHLNFSDNIITAIDLSNNTNLIYLDGYENMLTEIDVTNNIDLEVVTLYDNNISSLDVSQNTALVSLDMISNSMLTTIDFSNNLLLESLYLSGTSVSAIDLEDQSSFTDLECIGCALTSLNLKNGNNTNVIYIDVTNNPNLICALVDDAAYSTTNWTNIDVQTSFNDIECTKDYALDIKLFLQGAAMNPNNGEEALMRDDLRLANLIPTTSPYADAVTCNSSVFTTTGNNAIVDWVWLELRDPSDSSIVSYSQSALLQRDGDLVATDGVSSVIFSTGSTSYYLHVAHHNHLGILTNAKIELIENATLSIDFTDVNNQITYGNNAQTINGMPTDILGMWSGDVNGDGIIQYSGANSDTPNILSEVLNDSGNFLGFPTFVVTAYSRNDVNMDGNIQYSGANPDVPYVLQNILSHPNNFLNFNTYQIVEQLP